MNQRASIAEETKKCLFRASIAEELKNVYSVSSACSHVVLKGTTKNLVIRCYQETKKERKGGMVQSMFH